MSLRPPQKKDIKLIKPGEILIGAYTSLIIDTVKTSAFYPWMLTYYYDDIDLEHKNELQAYLAFIGSGNVIIPLYENKRADLPDINAVSKGNLISSVNRNVLTLDSSHFTGTFMPGDLLNVGNHCLHIMGVSGNDITIENMPLDFNSLSASVTCSTRRYQITAKRTELDREFTELSPNRFESPPITFLEVI